MTFDEALRELAVDASTPPEDARRAYLRLLKTRKPEVDPEGFRRLREAYEIVKQGPLGPFLAANARAPSAPTTTAPVRSSPPDPEVKGEEVDVVRDAVPPPPAPVDVASLRALVHEGNVAEAARMLGVAFEEGAQSFASREALVPFAIDVLLMLQSEGALDQSLALGWSLQAYLSETECEARAIRGDYVAKWAVARELDSLPRDFPRELRGAFSRAALAADPSRVGDTIFAFRLADPNAAHAAAVVLRNRAPLLARWYLPALSPRARPVAASWGQRSGTWVLVVLAMRVFRFVAGNLSAPSVPDRPPSIPAPATSSRVTFDERTDAYAQQALRSLIAGDCAAARATLRTLEGIRDRATDAAKKRTESIVVRVRTECPVGPEGGTP